MFEVMDLSGRPLPELKEIAKAFSIDNKGLAKPELILKIMDAQSENNDFAREVASKFSRREQRPARDQREQREPREQREKRPRKVKLDPIPEESFQDTVAVQQEEEPEPPVA